MQRREIRIRQASALLIEYLIRIQNTQEETMMSDLEDDDPPSPQGNQLQDDNDVSNDDSVKDED